MSKLTKRELWLMKEAYAAGRIARSISTYNYPTMKLEDWLNLNDSKTMTIEEALLNEAPEQELLSRKEQPIGTMGKSSLSQGNTNG